jgi:hypothetical protein
MTDALAVNTASGLEPNVKRQRVSLEVPPTEKVESIDENGVASLVRIAPREVRLNEKLAKFPLPQIREMDQLMGEQMCDTEPGGSHEETAAGAEQKSGVATSAAANHEAYKTAHMHLQMAHEEMHKLYWLLDLHDRKKVSLATTDVKPKNISSDNAELLQRGDVRIASKQRQLKEASTALRERAAALRKGVTNENTFYRQLAQIGRNWTLQSCHGGSHWASSAHPRAQCGQMVDCHIELAGVTDGVPAAWLAGTLGVP